MAGQLVVVEGWQWIWYVLGHLGLAACIQALPGMGMVDQHALVLFCSHLRWMLGLVPVVGFKCACYKLNNLL